MTEDATTVGMRQLKRRATANAITEQMLKLAAERGFDAVTVDEVAEAARVSRRTFFNYFASKEDALFGNPLVELEPALYERFIEGGPTGDLVTDALALVRDQNLFPAIGSACMQDLHGLMTENPKLLIQFKQRLHSRHDELAGWIAQREDTRADDPRVKVSVALVTLLIGLTMERMATGPDLNTEELERELDHTLALVKGLLHPSNSKD